MRTNWINCIKQKKEDARSILLICLLLFITAVIALVSKIAYGFDYLTVTLIFLQAPF